MGFIKRYATEIGPGFKSPIAGTAAATAGGVGDPTKGAQVGAVLCAHVIYDYSVDGGAQTTITPVQTVAMPLNAICLGGVINAITAPVGSGATVGIGIGASGLATSILTATAITEITLDVVTALTCVATPFKVTTAGNITFTIGSAPLTAGKIEAFVLYTVAKTAHT